MEFVAFEGVAGFVLLGFGPELIGGFVDGLGAANSLSHGVRYRLLSISDAAGSPMISSFAASQVSFRAVRREMLLRWQAVAIWWPDSRSELG